jgi:hypothetical protein
MTDSGPAATVPTVPGGPGRIVAGSGRAAEDRAAARIVAAEPGGGPTRDQYLGQVSPSAGLCTRSGPDLRRSRPDRHQPGAPGLREALAACREGDTLVASKLDRLARGTSCGDR